MATFDVVIRGGSVVDGSGAPPRAADVAIKDGRIAEVGSVAAGDGVAGRTIDADGALVTPGFVDIHTHYDGQATWDSQLLPSAWHGVTTVVFGNCGVGFAPVHPGDHDKLIELMEGVEDIPGAALHEGLTWEWESFPQYLDALEARPHDIDFAAQVPHGALRLFVMGERGANREPATPEEIDRMGEIVREAVEAGALGFTTSRTLNHRTSKGEPTPTLTAAEEELVGIAEAMGASGKGVLEVVTDFLDMEREFNTFRHMVEASGRPLSVSLAQGGHRPEQYREILDLLAKANADGLQMRAQVAARAVGILQGLQGSSSPFGMTEAWKTIQHASFDERLAAMRDPSFRERLTSEERAIQERMVAGGRDRYASLYPLGDPPDYEPSPSDSVAARAAAAGVDPVEFLYDLLLSDEGRAFVYVPFLNYAGGNLDPVREMLDHPNTVPGLSDGGAHVGMICDGSFPTTLLTHWGRDRSRGDRLDVSALIAGQTRSTAEAVGLLDRGLLAPGMKADVNVIDFDNLTLRAPTMAFDLPAGGRRLLQRAEGYLHTFVSGEEVYAGGEHTGALPGRLLRGAQSA
jgi:N-acyl-D-aspartate/D-glutamate deacylase